MTTFALWGLDKVTRRRATQSDTFRYWWNSNRDLPAGTCFAASGAWLVAMMALFVPTMFLFSALQDGGADLRWWGAIPAALLSAAVVGSAVNGLRYLIDDDAAQTLSADVLIAALITTSTCLITGLQLLGPR